MSTRFMKSTMLVRLASCISAAFSGRMALVANSSEYRRKSFPEEDEPRICLRVSAWLWLTGCMTSELALILGLYTFKRKEHL